MKDVFDKEVKQIILLMAGLMIFLYFVFPVVMKNLFTFNLLEPLTPFISDISTRNLPEVKLDPKKDYAVTVNTSAGSFEIDLFEKNAPQNVANFLRNRTLYSDAKVTGQRDFLFKVDAKNDPQYKVDDEINADYLMLDRTKVRDAKFLKDLYDPKDSSTQAFSSENLAKYEDFTLKEFYSEVLGYKYNPEVKTQKAVKYTVYMASTGPNQNKADFFVLMTDNAPQIDGRYTPIGQVKKGFDVLDKINQGNGSVTVRSIVVKN